MKINVKKLSPDAVIPVYAKAGDAGLDLTAVSRTYDEATDTYEYGIGFAIEIPDGYEGQVRPRSSIKNYGLILCNTPGTIDSGYRGEVKVVFRPAETFAANKVYEVGERVAQLVIKPVPYIELIEVSELRQTERGAGGYGSTGK